MATVAVQSGTRSHGNSIFTSVFPPKYHTTPTPEATPNIGTLSSPGAAFGGFNITSNPEDDAVKFNRAWSAATRFLNLPPCLEGSPRSLDNSPDAETALHFLLSSPVTRKELVDWYFHEISTHFRNLVLPELSFLHQPVLVSEARNVLAKTVQILRQAQQLYLSVSSSRSGSRSSIAEVQSFIQQIKQNLHALVSHSLPCQRLQKTLASYFFEAMKASLLDKSSPAKCVRSDRCYCQLDLDLTALHELHELGLGGSHGERAFAHAVHRLLQGPAIERKCFQVDWNGKASVIVRLRAWVHEQVVPSIERAVAALSGDTMLQLPIQQFISTAISSFGRLRVSSIFDYVVSWPASEGAILDLREYLNVNGTEEKAHLCLTFTDQMHSRLLHAGASTTEILSVYINAIYVFKLLDSRGVLLEKVAFPIRSYLRSREDTVLIIATSLLADIDGEGDVRGHDLDKVCADLTIELAKSAVDAQGDRLLNWNDMQWVPDPIDAGPNYKSSKSDDVVAYVLGLFDQDDFIKALSTAFGEHLIHTREAEMSKETKLIELLKSRLDATKLQQSEVMLKDLRDSIHLNKRLNADAKTTKPTPKDIQAAIPNDGITTMSLWNLFRSRMSGQEFSAALSLVAKKRNDLCFPKRIRLPSEQLQASPAGTQQPKPDFNAKVLSSYFWPQLRNVEFKVPELVKEHMEKYEEAFSSVSGQRKLEWKPGLSTIDIKLEFEDRVFEEDGVELWKSSIIDIFTLPEAGTEGITVPALTEALEMPEDYALGGIGFWLSKRVIYEKSTGVYSVLEHLDMDIHQVDENSQLDIEAISAIKSEDAMLHESAPIFQNFISNMLQNGGAKEIEGFMGITNMLKMVLPNFSYGDKEVKWLLEDMEGRAEVARNGEMWSACQKATN